ncbi:MAG: peptidoglycan DD-metalloendopeptidase family protein [Treponema sp.]|nr:peptidoglycan DD-metalloendopeptidase family protein [Treponema sp.]
MNFDQLGKQHVSRRRKPSPLKNARRSPASFDASFSQEVWPRPKSAGNAFGGRRRQRHSASGRGKKRSRFSFAGFSIPKFNMPGSWFKNIAVALGILVIGIVGPNWDAISEWFKVREVSPLSLQDTSPPLPYREAGAKLFLPRDLNPPQESPVPAFEEMPLNLTETFSWTEYEVRRGDSISRIAAKHSISMESIIAFNGLREAWNLRVGRKLKIPNMNGIPYTVQKNDTLSKIAERMKTPTAAILDANDIQSDTIRVGEVLFIPGGRMDANEFRRAIRRETGRQNAAERLMIYPVGGKITSGYGWRLDPVNPRSGVTRFHHAIDLLGSAGDPIKAAMRGTVLNTAHDPNLGNFIILGHGEYQTLYAHLSEFSVKTGDTVEQGQQIGKVGNTGYTTNPHLHFEVFLNAKRINPLEVLK